MESSVLQVEALFPFKGKNNDELCFKKGSIITVTQNDDETWWEGTLDGNTGWFPANYVRPCKPAGTDQSAGQGNVAVLSPSSEQQMFRALVLRNLLDSEREHISELSTLLNKCLKPLSSNKPLCIGEYTSLLNHMEQVIAVHEQLLGRLEAEGEKSSADQRVGGVFLSMGGDALTVPHHQYCSQHPKAVAFLQQHKAEIDKCLDASGLCESEDGSKKPGLLVLTTGLSRPFRRLQQYSGLLQELYRHLPEAHKDRGDASRAAKVMADLSSGCTALRRQKELELEVVTGQVSGWDRGTLAVLGDVQRMGSVALMPHHNDVYLVLFPKHLVILSVSPRMSNFIFQSQHNLNDIISVKLDDCEQYKNAFEISGSKMEPIIAVCQSKSDRQQWVTALSSPSSVAKHLTAPPPPVSTSASAAVFGKQLLTPQQKHSKQPPLPPHKALPVSPPPSVHGVSGSASVLSSSVVSSAPSLGSHKSFGLCHLRPSPPLRPHQIKRTRNSRKDEKWHEEDSLILRVVEAYCSSTAANHRFTPGYTMPHDTSAGSVLSPSHDKRSRLTGTSSLGGAGPPVWDERNMFNIVQNLQAELSKLSREHDQLKQEFERERQDSMRLRAKVEDLLPQT